MSEDITPTVKPAVSPYVAPLRLLAVGTLRVVSMGLAAMADSIESKKD
jgi:hypothetical protein